MVNKEPLPKEYFDDDIDDDPEYEPGQVCYVCGGSGLSIEGWDCEACDGGWYLEI